MVRKKQTVQHLYDYGVVCSYDELVRFRTSAAAQASQRRSQSVLRHHSTSLIQTVADNFDCNISSMNGLQHGNSENENSSKSILRLKTGKMKNAVRCSYR